MAAIHPDDLGILYGDYDAAVLSALADGAAVTSWRDRGYFGVTATPPSGRDPIYRTAANGLAGYPAVEFNGSNQALSCNGVVVAGDLAGSDKPFTVAAVLSYSASPAGDVFFSLTKDSAGITAPVHTLRVHTAGEVSQRRGDDAGPFKTSTGGPVVAADTPYVRLDVFSGVAGSIWLDAEKVVDGYDLNVGACSFDRANIGGTLTSGSSSNFFGGKLVRLLIFAGALTDDQALGISEWLQEQYGLAASAVRSTMSSLIARLRLMIGDAAGAAQQFSDEELQNFLDTYRTEYSLLPLEAIRSYSNGQEVYLSYQAPVGNWEADASLQDSGYGDVTATTSNYLNGRWTFATEPEYPLYVNGKAYDLASAAADACEAWAAVLARQYDFASNEQSFKRSQQAAALLKMADKFRSGGQVRTVEMSRSDVMPTFPDYYERSWRR